MSKISTIVSLQLKSMDLENLGSRRRRGLRVMTEVTTIMGARIKDLDRRQQRKIIRRRSPSPH